MDATSTENSEPDHVEVFPRSNVSLLPDQVAENNAHVTFTKSRFGPHCLSNAFVKYLLGDFPSTHTG